MNIETNISFPEFENGSVWLVGAGPGDARLLTLFAYHALQKADVIVHDALVDQSILDLAPKSVIFEHMGKRGGKKSPKQHEITQRLLELAQQNKRVLRLKGGDPFVFGRGTEEALPLLKENIPVRIVPGVTAGIAGSAYAGVPVTEGASNQVISFVTGHDQSGKVPSVNWQALAQSSPVIVFYMPMSQLEKIRQGLLDGGRSLDEPVCFVSHATTDNQKICDATLENMLEAAKESDIKSPALLIVGPTVNYRQHLVDCFKD